MLLEEHSSSERSDWEPSPLGEASRCRYKKRFIHQAEILQPLRGFRMTVVECVDKIINFLRKEINLT